MSDKEMELECLKLAVNYSYNSTEETLRIAKMFSNFISGTAEPLQTNQSKKD